MRAGADLCFDVSIVLVVIILKSNFFEDKFGVHMTLNKDGSNPPRKDHNDPQLHMIVYLQVAIISQALIFVTRSHGFFFMERPSTALMVAFCIAQLISSIIAGFADWGFTKIHSISGGWIGIVWVWVSILSLAHIPASDPDRDFSFTRTLFGSSLLT